MILELKVVRREQYIYDKRELRQVYLSDGSSNTLKIYLSKEEFEEAQLGVKYKLEKA